MTRPTNIRASMLPSYFDCARRAAAKQYRREIEDAGYELRNLPPSAGASIGTAAHAGAEYLFRVKLETGEPGSAEDAVALAVDTFREKIADGAEWDDTSPNPNTAVFQIGRIVTAYVPLARQLLPTAVERALRADVGDGFELTGHIDVETIDIREREGVRDLKTGALDRPYQAQLGAYALLKRAHGQRVDEVAMDWIKRAPKTKPQPPVQTTEYDVGTCERAAWATVQRIKSDVIRFRETADPWSFFANPMSLMCSARYCPAFGTSFCDMHKQKKGE